MGRRLGTAAVEFATHEALYENISPHCDIEIIENVPEYGTEHAEEKLGPEYETKAMVIDPRVLGLPAARARIFIIGWKRKKLQWVEGFDLLDFMDAITSKVALQAKDYWSLSLPPRNLTPSEET